MNAFDLRAETVYRWIMGSPDLPAERRRGATLALARKPKDAKSGRSASTLTPYPPMPMLFVVVLASSIGLLALAVVGAYALIRAVFGSD